MYHAETNSCNSDPEIRKAAKLRSRKKNNKPWIDKECEIKYKNIKSLSKSLKENPWDNHLGQTLLFYIKKEEFNRLTRKKDRLFLNKLIYHIFESEQRDSAEFWKSADKLKRKF